MINISIVLFNNKEDFFRILSLLNKTKLIFQLIVIDNSPKQLIENTLLTKFKNIEYHFNSNNIGYGAGHNIALKKSIQKSIEYHLVLNSDITFKISTINKLLDFMDLNPDIGHLMPKIINPDKSIQKVVKLLPSPMDLFGRAFLPSFLIKKSDSKYTLSDFKYNKVIEIPNLSGCFMLLRTTALKEVGLFDERYFMYAEDIDLTRRINSKYKTVIYPYLEVIHRHEKASFKSLKMKIIHTISVIKYFNKWGWIYDSERSRINKKILSQF